MAELMKHGGRLLYNLLTGQVGDEDTFTLVSIMNRRSSLRGVLAVLVWTAAIVWSSLVVNDDTLSSEIKLLVAGRADDSAKLLSASWFSVAGFNAMQVITLGVSAVLLTARQWLEDADGSVEGTLMKIVGLVVSAGRIVVDVGLFLVSLAASVYSLEAFFKLSNVQPGNDLQQEGDARGDLIQLFAILGLQLLTFSELWRRQGMKGLSNVAALKADQRNDKATPAQIATDLGLNAKDNGLKIHNFY